MTDQNDARVEVIQSDRDAAADMLDLSPYNIVRIGAENVRLGYNDRHPYVERCARHRIASAATARGEAVEECARVAEREWIAAEFSGELTVAFNIMEAIRSLAPARDEGGE